MNPISVRLNPRNCARNWSQSHEDCWLDWFYASIISLILMLLIPPDVAFLGWSVAVRKRRCWSVAVNKYTSQITRNALLWDSFFHNSNVTFSIYFRMCHARSRPCLALAVARPGPGHGSSPPAARPGPLAAGRHGGRRWPPGRAGRSDAFDHCIIVPVRSLAGPSWNLALLWYHSFPMISYFGLWHHSQYHIMGTILIMIS